MQLNANFDQLILLNADELHWVDSPIQGVQRRMLDRLGGEVARATSIVRYAPGSQFSPHVHTGGEELLVLEGVFQDEHGDFPAGSYLRNPPESRHTPGSQGGCVIFVKLWQFDLADRTQVRCHLCDLEPVEDSQRSGVCVTALHENAQEKVQVERWVPGTKAQIDAYFGAELLMLEGEVVATDLAGSASSSSVTTPQKLRKHSWLRLPLQSTVTLVAGSEGATFWIKSGHLRYVSPPAG